MSSHVRNELDTRRRYGLIGSGRALPDHLCVAWCGEDASNTWFFTGADHVLQTVKAGSTITPCEDCLFALWGIIRLELSKQEGTKK